MNYWQFIETKLKENKTVYLLTVMRHQGSSPGRKGFKMVVASDGEIIGSVGGGVMEFNIVEECRALLKTGSSSPFVKLQVHKGTIKDGSGMICSGEQTVICYPLNQEHRFSIAEILNVYENQETGLLIMSPDTFSFEKAAGQIKKYEYIHTNDTDWQYQEALNKKDSVYIVGGGHVGLASSKLLKQLGFYVVLYDNRRYLNTFEENTYADKKEIIDYNQITSHINLNASDCLLIMTNKYTDDKLVLSKLVRSSSKFIGVLGSKAKLKVLFEVLLKEGFTQSELDKVQAPIGLEIHSQTPDEIAVSIAAQLIKIRNKKK